MRVGLDIDGVLCDHVAGLCERIRERYHIDLRPEMVTEWDLDFGPSSVAEELRSAYMDRHFVLSLPPMEGAQAAVSAILETDGLAVTAVTSRPLQAKPATDDWLAAYFPSLDALYASRKEDMPLDILVDDFPLFVERFAAAGRRAVLFSQPWNQRDEDHLRSLPGITVARDWDDAVRLITSISLRRTHRAR